MIEAWIGIAACVDGRWSPRIGDPSVMGWATVAAYAATAALVAVTAATARAPEATRGRERLFWLLLAGLLALLTVNKQLDLQSALTAVGRCVAQRDGWYGERRAAQAAFILALGAASLLGGLGLALWLRRTLRRTGLACLGVAALLAFVMIRAVGFHHMDALIGAEVGGWRMNWALELGAIALVALGAVRGLAAGR